MFGQSWRISFLAVVGLRDVGFASLCSEVRLYPRLIRYSMSSRLRWSKKVSVEHMRWIRRKRLNGVAILVWFGWQDVLRRY